MTNITQSQAAIASCCDRIQADCLTEGDTIIYQGNRILVVTEPHLQVQGIVFDAHGQDVSRQDFTQQLCLSCEGLFELVSHTPMDDTLRAA